MIPFPVVKLTMEQEFAIRKLTQQAGCVPKNELINLLTTLLRQNFVYNNTITNLVKNWNEAELQGITTGSRDSAC